MTLPPPVFIFLHLPPNLLWMFAETKGNGLILRERRKWSIFSGGRGGLIWAIIFVVVGQFGLFCRRGWVEVSLFGTKEKNHQLGGQFPPKIY